MPTVYVIGKGRLFIDGVPAGDIQDLKLPTLYGEAVIVVKGASAGKTEVSLDEVELALGRPLLKDEPFALSYGYEPKVKAMEPPPPRTRKPPQPKFRPKDHYQNRRRF